MEEELTVVVLRRVPVLRCEAVVDRNNDSGDVATYSATYAVVAEGVRREEREAAPMEVDDDREGAGGRGDCGGEDSEPEFVFGVNGDIFRGNTVNG